MTPASLEAADRAGQRRTATLVLDISGPEDARPVIEMFFAPAAA